MLDFPASPFYILKIKTDIFESAVKFRNIELKESVIMPNHLHGIIVIVGAALCGRPVSNCPFLGQPEKYATNKTGQPHRVAPTKYIYMTRKKQKLELTWIGKKNRTKLEPRILLEDPVKS